MKFKLLSALLGFQLSTKKPLLGGDPFATLKEEDCTKIENELERLNNQDFQEQLNAAQIKNQDLEKALNEQKANNTAMENAIKTALESNELEAGETPEASIQLLGEKCKEYGESKNRHTFSNNDGEQEDPSNGLIDGVVNPNDNHNKID